MKKNWLTLNSETFLWKKGEKGLLYNSSNFTSFAFINTKEINSICDNLLDPDNLYSTSIPENVIINSDVNNWINSIISKKMGQFNSIVKKKEYSLSLMPILKIQDNQRRYIWEHNREIQGSIINNLHEVTFYINGAKNGDANLYKQTVYPLKTTENLNYSKIISFCNNCKNIYFQNINLVGSLISYSPYQKLLNGLYKLNIPITINITIEDFLSNKQAYIDLAKEANISLKILFKTLNSINNSLLIEHNSNFFYNFLITSINDYESVTMLIDKYNIESNSQITPIFEDNIDFFESSIFLNEDDFSNMNLTKRDVFIRQSLNLNDFGKLTILPIGHVYSNINHARLGDVDDLPVNLVYKEFTKGKSWFNLRNKTPCDQCVYQFLCPSPSNYEIIIKRNNLCNLTS